MCSDKNVRGSGLLSRTELYICLSKHPYQALNNHLFLLQVTVEVKHAGMWIMLVLFKAETLVMCDYSLFYVLEKANCLNKSEQII